MKKIRKGSTAYYLLLAMGKTIEVGFSIADFVDNPGKFAWTGYRTDPNVNSLYRASWLLREHGYVEIHKDGHKNIHKLTQKGKDEAIGMNRHKCLKNFWLKLPLRGH